jgi:signal transduction histidine kinase
MKLKSMRVRLPLTYAAIAFLTALALGGVLYFTLKGYYTKQERIYLMDRAVAIRSVLNKTVDTGMPPKVLDSQVGSLAFFTQARVRVLDNQQHVLADSGDPTQNDVFSVLPITNSVNLKASVMSMRVLHSQSSNTALPNGAGLLPGVNVQAFPQRASPPELVAPISRTIQANGPNIFYLFRSGAQQNGNGVTTPMTETIAMLSAVPKSVAFSSYDLISGGQDGKPLSTKVVDIPIQDSKGNVVGTLELSGGPTFGGAILDSVTKATLVAALVAVLLAAFVGWLVSRQVTRPLIALTQVTREMAEGDLSARADVLARDEFGVLGESFNQMANRIEETVGALRKFASDAAHELKTPLTALITDLELAFEDMHTARLDISTLERAQLQVQRLNRLMDGLLDLSRLESGLTPQQRQPVDLAHLIRKVSEPFAAQAEVHQLNFDLELPVADPSASIIMAEEGQIRRALANLLENAIKFTPPGGAIQLRLTCEDNQVEIEVRDSGIGIPNAELDQVFQRFHRARNASSYPGSGLGLAIVKAIVDAHDGQVWAAPAAPHGTRFVIRLPLKNP